MVPPMSRRLIGDWLTVVGLALVTAFGQHQPNSWPSLLTFAKYCQDDYFDKQV